MFKKINALGQKARGTINIVAHRKDSLLTDEGIEKVQNLYNSLSQLPTSGNERANQILKGALEILDIFIQNRSLSELRKHANQLLATADIVDNHTGVYAPPVFDPLTHEIAKTSYEALKELNLEKFFTPEIKKNLNDLTAGKSDKVIDTLKIYLLNNISFYEAAASSDMNLLCEQIEKAKEGNAIPPLTLLQDALRIPSLSVIAAIKQENAYDLSGAAYYKGKSNLLMDLIKTELNQYNNNDPDSHRPEIYQAIRNIVDPNKVKEYEKKCHDVFNEIEIQLQDYLKKGGHAKKIHLINEFLATNSNYLTLGKLKARKSKNPNMENFSIILDLESALRSVIAKHNIIVKDTPGISQGNLGNILMEAHKKVIDTISEYDISKDKELDKQLNVYAEKAKLIQKEEDRPRPRM